MRFHNPWLLFFAAIVFAGCRHSALVPQNVDILSAPVRGMWEVRHDTDGYTACYVRRVAEDRVDLIVGQTAVLQADWAKWIESGNSDAASRMTLILQPGSLQIQKRYDWLKEEVFGPPAGESGFRLSGRRIAAGAGVVAPGRLPVELRTGKPGFWLGIYGDPTKADLPGLPQVRGLRISTIGAMSAAANVGLQPGDVVVSAGLWGYDDPVFEGILPLARGARDRYLPQDILPLQYLRDGVLHKVDMQLPEFPTYDRQISAEFREAIDSISGDQPSPEEELLDILATATDSAEANADLLQRLSAAHTITDVGRLWPMVAAHTRPFATLPVKQHCVGVVLPLTSGAALQDTTWLDSIYLATPPPAPTLPDYRGADLDGHLAYIDGVLAASADFNRAAFAAFTDDERTFIAEQMPGLLQGFTEAHMMWFDTDLERQTGNVKLGMMLRRLDMGALIAQFRTTALLLDEAFIVSIGNALGDRAQNEGILVDHNGGAGRVLIGGPGNDRYLSGADAAVLIDLGGDDFYGNNTGSSVPGSIASAVLIDLGGDDFYENWRHMRQGCGFMGVGLIADHGGDDTYIGIRGSQGTGFAGIGVLADWQGSDTYRSIDYGQGVGQLGAGLLIDRDGDNRFDGHLSCQGVGFTGGLGIVYSAGETGNDTYYNKGQHMSGYADDASFAGWGQGVGIGHRPYFSGGIGMIVDNGGNDQYAGGTFSIGGGYYYGLGIVNDRSGDDRYRGTRYNMGFTAHQAVGIFVDERGDDDYRTTHYVASGMAWDECTTLFIDGQGDDRYDGPGFAHCHSAQNGFTIFVDGDGSDRYIGSPPAKVNGNQYHDGTSVAYFLDLGSGVDDFGSERNANELYVFDDYAFFVDAESTAAAIMKAKAGEIRNGKDEVE